MWSSTVFDLANLPLVVKGTLHQLHDVSSLVTKKSPLGLWVPKADAQLATPRRLKKTITSAGERNCCKNAWKSVVLTEALTLEIILLEEGIEGNASKRSDGDLFFHFPWYMELCLKADSTLCWPFTFIFDFLEHWRQRWTCRGQQKWVILKILVAIKSKNKSNVAHIDTS